MWIGIVSLFPEMFQAISQYGITRRAMEKNILTMAFWNPRDFAEDRHQTVDDKPYGGGPGMLMKVEPLRKAIAAAKSARPIKNTQCPVIVMSPQGKKLEQKGLEEWSDCQQMVLVAGRYEGIDERLIEQDIDFEISIGDYVLSGGEVPAMVLIDGLTRLLPGAVGDSESVERESFTQGLLDYPQYTRPEEVEDHRVPNVLLSGDHGEIEKWRMKQALGRTFKRRPDLIEKYQLSANEQQLLDEFLQEETSQQSKSRNIRGQKNEKE